MKVILISSKIILLITYMNCITPVKSGNEPVIPINYATIEGSVDPKSNIPVVDTTTTTTTNTTTITTDPVSEKFRNKMEELVDNRTILQEEFEDREGNVQSLDKEKDNSSQNKPTEHMTTTVTKSSPNITTTTGPTTTIISPPTISARPSNPNVVNPVNAPHVWSNADTDFDPNAQGYSCSQIGNTVPTINNLINVAPVPPPVPQHTVPGQPHSTTVPAPPKTTASTPSPPLRILGSRISPVNPVIVHTTPAPTPQSIQAVTKVEALKAGPAAPPQAASTVPPQEAPIPPLQGAPIAPPQEASTAPLQGVPIAPPQAASIVSPKKSSHNFVGLDDLQFDTIFAPKKKGSKFGSKRPMSFDKHSSDFPSFVE